MVDRISLKIGEIYTHKNGAKIQCVKSEHYNCSICCFSPFMYNSNGDEIDNELTFENCKNIDCHANNRSKIGLEPVDVYFKRINCSDENEYNKDNVINNPFNYYSIKTI